jgi:NADH:ubiquinone oxidoreductase subunit F (NADH-binding)/ferredoxin
MDRRLATNTEQLRFRVDATRCDGQGVCVLIAPELFELDRYGYAYIVPGSAALVANDPDVRARGLEADAMCPRNAIREELALRLRPDPVVAQPRVTVPVSRLTVDAPESVAGWHERGGWGQVDEVDVALLLESAGVIGQGGAAFPTSVKWRRLAGAQEPIVVANSAEREPGTLKDRYLLRHRPGLVLDGLRIAMRAIGATQAHVAIDEESDEEHAAFSAAIDAARAAGRLTGLNIVIDRVPARYVVGEETALISVIDGGKPVPRIRPPFPSEIGLAGRPTLVQNVETLAQVALAVALGAEEFRSVGAPDAAGTGLFTVGPFGGPFTVVERPYGYPVRQLLVDAGLAEGARAVLVGGYAGGLLAPADLDVALAPGALTAAGAALGTKSVQVIGPDTCVIEVTRQILDYFAGETASQCPPCSKGLPDMAAQLGQLTDGTATTATVAEVREFMRTLSDRGVCRLPDGAARVTLSLLDRFAADISAHVDEGCNGH